jgi:chromosome segregation ATPase
MARAGLNKHLVKQARDAILVRGHNPSLDAIRIELGNTGSKTTIHRYLKDLEEEEGTRLDDASLLSETLTDLVGRVAARLHEEAHAIVEQAAAQHAAHIQQLQASLREQQLRLAKAEEDHQVTLGMLDAEHRGRQTTTAALEQERLRAQRLDEQVRGLEVRLQEGEVHRQSLEQKHQQAREALEHYRQSVKEQRDQDQRRHEAQVQQVQAELRQLQQTLVVKQGEITQLTHDNGALVTERRELQRQIQLLERQAAQLEHAVQTTQRSLDQLQGVVVDQRQALEDARTRENELQQRLKDELAAHSQTRAELMTSSALTPPID